MLVKGKKQFREGYKALQRLFPILNRLWGILRENKVDKSETFVTSWNLISGIGRGEIFV